MSPRASTTRRGRLGPELIGLCGVVGVFVGLSLHHALAMPRFLPVDEQAHLGYTHAVAHGELPDIETRDRVPDSAVDWQDRLDSARDDRYRTVWVANHPPLHYVVTAPVALLSEALDWRDGGLMGLRAANVVTAALGVVLVYHLGTELARGDRAVGLSAAALVALLPQPHLLFAHGQNDGLAFATATLVLVAGARYAHRGHSRRAVALLGTAVALAAASRLAGLLVGALVVGALAVGALVRRGDGWRHRLGTAAAVGVGGVAPAAVLTGWFYARNAERYGDLGASAYLLERFGRSRRGSLWEIATTADLWRDLADQLTARPFRQPMVGGDPASVLGPVLAVIGLAVLGLVLAAATRRGSSAPSWPGVGLCVGATVVVAATVAQHVAGGGTPFARYLFPAVGAIAAVVALGLDHLLPRVGPALAAAGQAVVLAPLVGGIGRTLTDRAQRLPESLEGLPSTAAQRSGALALAAVAGTVLAGAFLRLAWSALAGSVVRRPAPAPEPAPVPVPVTVTVAVAAAVVTPSPGPALAARSSPAPASSAPVAVV